MNACDAPEKTWHGLFCVRETIWIICCPALPILRLGARKDPRLGEFSNQFPGIIVKSPVLEKNHDAPCVLVMKA
jgi:hypothetical protein